MSIFDSKTSTYRFAKRGNIQVEVGDAKQAEFKPRVKLMAWDNECNVSFGLADSLGATVSQDASGKISWQRADGVKSVFYDLDDPAIGEDGGFEFEIHLPKKPDSNIIELTLNVPKELEFYYQPPLTKEEIDAGHIRPDNVVGSYAVYHASQSGDYSKLGGKNYKTGKAFHIYRPDAVDAAGNRAWCDLYIEPEKQIATITIPQDWLDKAIYPVIVDPTFGLTSIGGTEYMSGNYMIGSKFQFPATSAKILAINSYVRKLTSDQADTELANAIYRVDAQNNWEKLAEDLGNVPLTSFTFSWLQTSIVYLASASTWYSLVMWSPATYRYRSDTVEQGRGFTHTTTFENWPVSSSGGGSFSLNNRVSSIYAIYGQIEQTVTIDTRRNVIDDVAIAADTRRRISVGASASADTLREVIDKIEVEINADTLRSIMDDVAIAADTRRRMGELATALADTRRRVGEGVSVSADTRRWLANIIRLGDIDLLAEFGVDRDLLARLDAEISLAAEFVLDQDLLAELALGIGLDAEFDINESLEGDVDEMMQDQDFAFVPGDDVRLNFAITMADGDAIGDAESIVFSAHKGTIIKTLSKGITVTGADTFKVELTAEDTARLTVPSSYSIRVTNALGKIHTVASGKCTPMLI